MTTLSLRAAGFRAVFIALVVLVGIAAKPAPAEAIEIQQVKSPGGIEAWLVEDPTVPLISMRFAFRGGAANDPAGKEGLASLLSSMIDEGAGELDSQAFQRKLSDLSVQMSFDAERDWFTGTLRTLSRNRDTAFELLSLALTAPRFDPLAFERIQGQLQVNLRRKQQDPDYLASRAWMRAAFKDHVYARPVDGTPETLAAISTGDLTDFSDQLFRRDGLKVAVVGDIDAETLARKLDEIFGTLPAPRILDEVSEADVASGPLLQLTELDVPQTAIQFGMRGLKRLDDDFIPAFVLNYILGGGGFSSRLYEEVREKRGLVYSVYTYLYPFEKAGVMIGGAATANATVAETVAVIRAEIARLAENGPTKEELEEAKTYLTGSYALRFDTGNKIAGQLIGLQQVGIDAGYFDRRNSLVEAVTLEDVKRAAKRFLDPDNLIFTLVGKPVDLDLQKTGG